MKSIRSANIIFLILGGAILAFGLYNVHSFSGVTEGGTLGLTLLFMRWFSVSPAISSVVLNGICYLIGWRVLGRDFILRSAISAASFAVFYAGFELIGPLMPGISEHRLLAAILGAVFVGVGVGICVRFGGAPCGDDALAMSIGKISGIGIQWVYLFSDITVLALSLTYIPFKDILYSLLTVVLSGQIIGLIERIGRKKS